MNSSKPHAWTSPGPFRPEQLHSGDPYEISNGHAFFCAPTGGDGTGPNGRGFMALDTDPMAANVGVDTGMQLGPVTMRAPDVAVGAFPERRGWVQGALPLAVEYAASGQNEEVLQEKIADMLSHGVQYVWVVRMVGPRRVEVHERSKPTRIVLPGNTLTAPGVLKNPVPVEALYDRNAAHEAAFTNILQRKGYQSLDQVRDEGIEKGIEKGMLTTLAGQFEHRLRRALEEGERETLTQRIHALGGARVGDVVLDLDATQLAAWLHDPSAT